MTKRVGDPSPAIPHDAVILSEATARRGRAAKDLRNSPKAAAKPACVLVVLLLFAALPVHASAQGCAQCLDSTRATPPAVQSAYRKAIFLMAGAGATMFIAGVFLLRKDS